MFHDVTNNIYHIVHVMIYSKKMLNFTLVNFKK
jgi:hypothetical protein